MYFQKNHWLSLANRSNFNKYLGINAKRKKNYTKTKIGIKKQRYLIKKGSQEQIKFQKKRCINVKNSSAFSFPIFPIWEQENKMSWRGERRKFSSTPQLSNSNDFSSEFVVLINFVSIFFQLLRINFTFNCCFNNWWKNPVYKKFSFLFRCKTFSLPCDSWKYTKKIIIFLLCLWKRKRRRRRRSKGKIKGVYDYYYNNADYTHDEREQKMKDLFSIILEL